MHPMLNTAIKAARQAGNVIIRNLDRLDRVTVEHKGRSDYVTEVDRLAEQEIIQVIRKAYPHHAILAEESGAHQGDRYTWIIDPLDGTTNFVHGVPQFAVSICLRHGDELDQAVIYDPVHNDLYTASRGGGAQLNNRRIRVSSVNQFEHALLGTGFPFREMDHVESWIAILRSVMPRSAGVRRPGSAALDLAYVAAGRFDAFWEFGLNIWDMAAGCLLIQEAGGMVSDPLGGRRHLESGNVVAGNPTIHAQLLRLMAPHLTTDLRM